MLTDDEITNMRTAANLALPDEATIKRPSRASDAAGGFRTTLSTLATGVDVRMDPPNYATRALIEVYSARIAGRQTTVLVFPAETNVEVDDQVEIGSDVWHVLSILSGSIEITRMALAVRV